ncbi:hypothetical protein [Vibrio sp. TBV020]|uniref:hypothetical protein n=1 Tax=Vibrio sp. TBV020 TaxID=3137398 RepID=UPI0038CDB720
MKELQQIVNDQINTMIETGAIEKMIEERLNQAVKETVNKSMCSYGDFGKALKGKVEESLNNAITHVTLPEYNKFIADVINESYSKVLEDNSKKQLVELITDTIEMPEAQISMQDLLDEVARCWGEEAGHYSDSIEIEWSDSHGIHFTLKHPEYDWQSIKVVMYDHGESGVYTIGYISSVERGKKYTSVLDSTYAIGLPGYLYKLYCAKTKIIDVSDVYGDDIYLGD